MTVDLVWDPPGSELVEVGHDKVVEEGYVEVGLVGLGNQQVLQLLLAQGEVHGTEELPFPAFVLELIDVVVEAAAAAEEEGGDCECCCLH